MARGYRGRKKSRLCIDTQLCPLDNPPPSVGSQYNAASG